MRHLLLLCATILIAVPGPAAAEWRSLSTSHFQVIGDVPAARLSDIALRFEQFREVVTPILPATLRSGSAPVVVVVFPDARSYRPFMPLASGRVVPVEGSFISGADANFITMNVESGERAFPVVFHEYTHLLLENAFENAPVWFTEGLAEYYSTFEVTTGGRGARIGKPIVRHVALLRERRLEMAQLLAIGRNSNEYTQDGPARDLLYAQSWALIHQARHGQPRHWDSLMRLARRLAAGDPLEESLRDAYPAGLDTLDADVDAYVRRQNYDHDEYEFTDSIVTRVTSEAIALDEAEVESWLAALLAHLQRGPEAIPRLLRALQARPDLPRALATLGILRIRQGNRAEGLRLLERAASSGPDIEWVLFDYGWALATEPVFDASKAKRAQTALERAIVLRPGYPAATQMLATVYGRTGDFMKMRDLMLPLVQAAPDNQDAVLQLAAALLGVGDIQAARSLLGPVLARPKDEDTRERARALLGQISRLQETR